MSSSPARLNIYVDDPDLRQRVRVAAARQGVTISAYCLEAIRRRIDQEGPVSSAELLRRREIGRQMDELREKVGPIGVNVRELIVEGRR